VFSGRESAARARPQVATPFLAVFVTARHPVVDPESRARYGARTLIGCRAATAARLGFVTLDVSHFTHASITLWDEKGLALH
jgi:hypothetical protein